MMNFRLSSLLLVWPMLAATAQASFYRFQCGDLTQVEVYGELDGSWVRSMNFAPRGATVMRFQSHGGLIEAEEQTLNRLRMLADQVRGVSGQRLKVVIAGECASACTIFAAGLNALARDGKLDFYLDARAQLGFHAGFNVTTQTLYPFELLIRYYLKNGVSRAWLERHRPTFQTRDLHWVAPADPWLADSNLFSHARLAADERTDFTIPLHRDCVEERVE